MAQLIPPWLDIRPEQFTQAAIAGGEQGYRAAGQAGELAQRSALTIAEMAQQAAARSAEIALRREQIQAELARNAANVAAARYNAALDFQASQNALGLAREREANAVAQNQAQLAATQNMAAEENALKERLGMARINAPDVFAPSEDVKTLNEIKRLEAAGDTESANLLRGILARRATESGGLRVSMPDPNNPASMLRPAVVSGNPAAVTEYWRTNSAPAAVTGTNLLTNPNDPLGLFR